MPNFTLKEDFKIYYHKTIFQKEANSICLAAAWILFVLVGATQDLESLEDRNRS